MFLKHSMYPSELYVNSKDGVYYNIKLCMDYSSKQKVFFNPRYYINEHEFINFKEFIDFIQKNNLVDEDGMINVLALEDGNNPILLKKVLEIISNQLKEKNDDSN